MLDSTIISVPSGSPNLPDFTVDLTEIVKVEMRKREIAYVNRETAHELLATINEAYCESLKIMTKISLEYQKAMNEANKRRAIVLLDIVPDELKRRGLASAKSPGGSEDFRNAILQLDTEYQELLDRSNAIKAFHELIKIKAKGFEMSFQSVKKVFDMTKTIPDLTNKLNADPEENYQIGIARF